MSKRRYEAHPESAPGDFYVVNQGCAACGMPHVVAPDLMGSAENDTSHCIWKRQPQTPREIENAIDVVLTSCVECHRYAGDDEQIIARLGWEFCDSPLRKLPARTLSQDPPDPPAFGLLTTRSPVFERIINAVTALFHR
jgi:hypothetical protein